MDDNLYAYALLRQADMQREARQHDLLRAARATRQPSVLRRALAWRPAPVAAPRALAAAASLPDCRGSEGAVLPTQLS